MSYFEQIKHLIDSIIDEGELSNISSVKKIINKMKPMEIEKYYDLRYKKHQNHNKNMMYDDNNDESELNLYRSLVLMVLLLFSCTMVEELSDIKKFVIWVLMLGSIISFPIISLFLLITQLLLIQSSQSVDCEDLLRTKGENNYSTHLRSLLIFPTSLSLSCQYLYETRESYTRFAKLNILGSMVSLSILFVIKSIQNLNIKLIRRVNREKMDDIVKIIFKSELV